MSFQRNNPDEFDRIVNLPNGIRTAKLAQETGTFVFCESSNINAPSAKRYPQLFLLDRSGKIISRDISKILSIITAKEDTSTALLPQAHNQTVTPTLRKFSKEVKQWEIYIFPVVMVLIDWGLFRFKSISRSRPTKYIVSSDLFEIP